MDENNILILLIDSNPYNADLFRKWLASVSATQYELYHSLEYRLAAPLIDQKTFDVFLVDVTGNSDSQTNVIEWLRKRAPNAPIVTLIHQDDERQAVKAVSEGSIQDYLIKEHLTAPLIKHSIHYAMNRAQVLESSKRIEENLQNAIEEQRILHRIDRELGYTLNIQNVLNLAMDTAVRRTGASGCVVGWFEEETQQLQKLASIGKARFLLNPIPLDQLDKHPSIMRIFQESSPIIQNEVDEQYSELIIPLIIQGRPTGMIGLEQVPTGYWGDQADWDFLVHLASRTSTALEKTRNHQRIQHQAIQMDKLHHISSDISSQLDRKEIMKASAAGLAVLLDGSSAFFCDYDNRNQTLIVRETFIVEAVTDSTPKRGTIYSLKEYPELFDQFYSKPIQIRRQDVSLTSEALQFVEALDVQSVLIAPLIDNDQLFGVLFLGESRFDRYFITDEVTLARSLAASTMVALQKATLFTSIQELEQLKSEMIQMASHDLRSPLSHIRLCIALLNQSPEATFSDKQTNMLDSIKQATDQMQTLLEDILNLERIESDETSRWQSFDLTELIKKVSDTLYPQADLNNQLYYIELPSKPAVAFGSEIQLQQAYSNFIGNAIKYTPPEGEIIVRAWIEDNRFMFEVQDNGFGIPADRQERIFERFYRAHAPGTEKITGTGLGLSLVKTVIERHGGEVWLQSEEGIGSTFGCALPLADDPKNSRPS
jgi:signal transduction histidine kinase/DNA-binding NarL/FixJ family response regulator